MLPSSLVRENFAQDGRGGNATTRPFTQWVEYHFGGRPEGEVCYLLEAAVQCTGIELADDEGYSEFFAKFSMDELLSCWQEVLAHA